jgi:hypothetical protein
LVKNIFASLLIGVKFLPEKIGKKEKPQNGKHYKKLNNNDEPYSSAPPRHIPEALIVKSQYP